MSRDRIYILFVMKSLAKANLNFEDFAKKVAKKLLQQPPNFSWFLASIQLQVKQPLSDLVGFHLLSCSPRSDLLLDDDHYAVEQSKKRRKERHFVNLAKTNLGTHVSVRTIQNLHIVLIDSV